jgi:hypothetical protein
MLSDMKVVKLMYGKFGLLTFVYKLFRGTTVADRQDFNYYFALRNNIHILETLKGDVADNVGPTQNGTPTHLEKVIVNALSRR